MTKPESPEINVLRFHMSFLRHAEHPYLGFQSSQLRRVKRGPLTLKPPNGK